MSDKIEPFDAFVRRVVPDYAHLILAHVADIEAERDEWKVAWKERVSGSYSVQQRNAQLEDALQIIREAAVFAGNEDLVQSIDSVLNNKK